MQNKPSISDEEFIRIKKFLLSNSHLFNQKVVPHYEDLFAKLVESNKEIYPLTGKCFPASKFIKTLFGADKISVHTIPSKKLPFVELEGKTYHTTHWFAKCRHTGKVYDPTIDQFAFEPYDKKFVETLYPEAIERDFGKYWHTDQYGNRVANPSKEVNRLLDEWNKVS